MNKENIQIVIDGLRSEKLAKENGIGFNMKVFSPRSTSALERVDDKTSQHCGTACCIAGWAVGLIEGFEELKDRSASRIERRATWLFDFDSCLIGEALFNGEEAGVYLVDIPLSAAIRVLEILRDEEKVDWARAMRECA